MHRRTNILMFRLTRREVSGACDKDAIRCTTLIFVVSQKSFSNEHSSLQGI